MVWREGELRVWRSADGNGRPLYADCVQFGGEGGLRRQPVRLEHVRLLQLRHRSDGHQSAVQAGHLVLGVSV